MDSDEDDEEPHNVPGISSTSQPFLPVLPLSQGPAAISHGPDVGSCFCGFSKGCRATFQHVFWCDCQLRLGVQLVCCRNLSVTSSRHSDRCTLTKQNDPAAAANLCFSGVTVQCSSLVRLLRSGQSNVLSFQSPDFVRYTHRYTHCFRPKKWRWQLVSCTKRSVSSGSTRILQTVC